ncbi:hypothetical protein ACFZA2_10380 [Microbacterium sp. NPDC007973]|uniref:hypothetical protein n=1 Tax=Microbacterium sp. NPDC007973 TaxID=3364182 RepID=UPI0036DFB43E
MEPDWSLWVHDSVTGEPIERVDWAEGSDGPFSASIAGDGQSSILVYASSLLNPDAAPGQENGRIASLFAPNLRFLVRWWGVNGGAHPLDDPLVAHKIESWDYDDDKGTVAVTAVDLIGEAAWRLVGGVAAEKDVTLTISGRSAAGAVRQTLARMMQWGPEWVYPIDLPADGPGDFSGTYPFWKGFSIEEILDEIRKSEGVEIYLRPYATQSGGIRFQTRVGAPVTIGGAKFYLGAAETPISGVKYRIDGSRQVTGVRGIGNGTGEDQKTAWAGGGPFAIPIRDTKKSFDDMEGDALHRAVSQSFATGRQPIAQWDIGSFVIGADYPPELSAPGRVFNIEVHGNPVIPDGVHTLRVMAVSGGNGRQMKPEVQYAGSQPE